MKYEAFTTRVEGFPVIGHDLLSSLEWTAAAQNLQLNRWVSSGKLIRLKRGLYCLPDKYRRTEISLRWLANTLYSPSYISLEYVLSWHDLIPERVTALTSVSVLKTASFTNPLGQFIYRHLKNNLFFGFEEQIDLNGIKVLVATKEKALLDTIYLSRDWRPEKSYFTDNLRLQQLNQLKKNSLKNYAKIFNSKKIHEAVNMLIDLM